MVVINITLTYLLIGLLFSLVFITKLIHRVDEAVANSPWTFRLMLIPGCIILWPILFKRWMTSLKDRRHD
jgi:hypothetical protein